MADPKTVKKQISTEELKMLRDMKNKQRLQWVVRRWGTGDEKKQMTRGEYPRWARIAVNEMNWEIK